MIDRETERLEPSSRELIHSRLIPASPESVFAAWIEPSRLARWWGPAGFRNTFDECEPRAGGRWRYVMHAPDGRDFPNEGIFAEVVHPLRIVVWHTSRPRFALFATFELEGEGTRVTWRQRFESAEDCDRMRAIATPANEENLDRLEAEVAGR